jgi:hypothetical protein
MHLFYFLTIAEKTVVNENGIKVKHKSEGIPVKFIFNLNDP